MLAHKCRQAGLTVVPGTGSLETVFADRIQGNVIVNCAGITKQRKVPRSTYIGANSFGPHKLAEAADERGVRLIHVSTDCVFNSGGPNYEHNTPDGADIYALSKLAGEVTYGAHLTVRTSFVGFGPRGLIHDLQTRPSVEVSNNLHWSGHTVDTVAELLIALIGRPQIAGLLHIPGTFQTRYTLARDLKARWGFSAELDRNDDFHADRRLASGKWAYYGLPTPPLFITQLETMERLPYA